MNDITVKSFSEKFSLNENDVLDLIEKTRKHERELKKYAEVSDKLKNLKEKYINKFCYFDNFDNDIIIRITDVTILYGSFTILGAGVIKNDISQQISIVPKYEKITKLTTYNNTVEDLDDYINSNLISDVNDYIKLFLDKQAEFINATLLNNGEIENMETKTKSHSDVCKKLIEEMNPNIEVNVKRTIPSGVKHKEFIDNDMMTQ